MQYLEGFEESVPVFDEDEPCSDEDKEAFAFKA